MNSFDNNIFSQINGRVFLITGADGFFGYHLTKLILGYGGMVFAQVRSLKHLKHLELGIDRLTIIPMDFCELDSAALKEKIPQGVDVCIHLAAAGVKPNENQWDLLSQVNIEGTKAMLDVAVAKNIKRFVYIGTSFEYGDGNLWEESALINPRTLYGVSKAAGWMLTKSYAATHQIPVVGFRPFYLYGPEEGQQRLITSVINALKTKTPLPMTLGEQERDFVHIDDAVRAVLYGAIEPKAIGEMFNISSGEATSIRQAIAIMEEEVGQVFPLLWGEIPYRNLEWVRLSGSSNKAKHVLNFTTQVSLREGLKGTYEYNRDKR